MKNKSIKLFFAGLVFSCISSASAQIYVKVRPVVPVIVQTPQPSPAHVWIDEDWEPYGTTYTYVGGHWASPPHAGYTWRKGYWRRHNGDGEEWVRGRWAK